MDFEEGLEMIEKKKYPKVYLNGRPFVAHNERLVLFMSFF